MKSFLLPKNTLQCLQVIVERPHLEYVNEKYLENVSIYCSRFGRNSPYYVNIIGRNTYTWTNNVTVNLIFYEYLHNEYRRSFVEFHFKLCDMVNSDPYVGAMIANAGITCPVPPVMHYLVNMSIPSTADFKFKWPFKKCMVRLEMAVTSTSEPIGQADFYVTFADKKYHL
ncbi:uncharacterized protein LOC114356929 [Ostrinia furnacalis]|uniref:uncharacterized protein LOC114356929 n=1 Tax=Ostrinia furnacalis TaxID=93504 RepID=UPI00103BE652|nr:uncharacterized protein LOC114356929 [Ostrinia furnacalis]